MISISNLFNKVFPSPSAYDVMDAKRKQAILELVEAEQNLRLAQARVQYLRSVITYLGEEELN